MMIAMIFKRKTQQGIEKTLHLIGNGKETGKKTTANTIVDHEVLGAILLKSWKKPIALFCLIIVTGLVVY